MDLIYYYTLQSGAPSTVARKVFKYLLERQNELPFENLKLFVSSKYEKEVQNQFGNIEVLTYRTLDKVAKESIIHIHHVPLIFPNAKFLLYLFSVLKKKRLILRLPGEIRTAMPLRFKSEHVLNISQIPSYIATPYLLKYADKIIVHSYMMANLVENRYHLKNIKVIPNGIDDNWFGKSKTTYIELEGSPKFFYHGRLSFEKGVDLLIESFSGVLGKTQAKLYIAGDGPELDDLKKQSIRLGIEKNVLFLGHINEDQIKFYLSQMDAAFYPSRFDAFSLAILEAMSSANCPVFFSKKAGIYDFEIRDNNNLNSFEPTVENIYTIMKEIIGGNYCQQIVRQQKEFAKQYTWDKVINEYIDLYNTI